MSYLEYDLKYFRRNKVSEKEVFTEKKDGLLISKIKERIKKKKDIRIICQGDSGEGKSSLSLLGGELIQPQLYVDKPEYVVENMIHFNAKNFLSAAKRLPSNSNLIYDEPGQTWNNREFMSEANIIISKLIVGFRFKRFITWLNVPHIDLIDSNAQKLCHYMINIKEQGHAEVYEIIRQKFGGKPLFKNIIDDFPFRKPNVRLWHLYEKKKFPTQYKMYSDWEMQLKRKENINRTNDDIAESIIQNKDEYMRDGKYHIATIAGLEGIGRNRAEAIRELINKKYSTEE